MTDRVNETTYWSAVDRWVQNMVIDLDPATGEVISETIAGNAWNVHAGPRAGDLLLDEPFSILSPGILRKSHDTYPFL